ncbi:MAG: helix-turn-helix domain-containing protein [Acetobacterium sp.]
MRLYLEHDGSIQAVADASFTHRNTINYRMKKIRQLLNMDLTTMEERRTR